MVSKSFNLKKKVIFTPNLKFSIIISLLFFISAFLLIINHEMWHDETQEWLIAKDSLSYISLLNNYSSMRHPIGWVSCLWLLNRFTSSIFSMQLLNLLFAVIAVFIFVNFSPFSRIFKALFAFGYLPLYEYTAISREYALGMLSLFIFATLYQNRRNNFLLFSLTVILLANVSILTFLFSVVIFIFLIFDTATSLRNARSLRYKIFNIIIGFILMLTGIFFSFTILKPFTSTADISEVYFPIRNLFFDQGLIEIILYLFKSISRVFTFAFLPLPMPILRFWYTNFFINYHLSLILGLFVFLFTIVLFKRKGIYFLLWTTLVLAFYLLSLALFHRFCVRHYGFLFLYFIVCLWISDSKRHNMNLSFFKSRIAGLLTKKIILCILIIHIIGMAIATFFDLRHPFSRAKDVAKYIYENELENKFIIGWRDDFMPSIIAYGNLKQIYYPQGSRFGSFVVFDSKREEPLTFNEIIRPVIALGKKPEDFIFIFTPELMDIKSLEQININIGSNVYKFRNEAVFDNSIVLGESFALYKLKQINNQ